MVLTGSREIRALDNEHLYTVGSMEKFEMLKHNRMTVTHENV